MARKKRGHGEGSITQRSYGSWRAQVTIDGKRHGKTFKKKTEAQTWLRKTQFEIDKGLTYSSTQINLEQFLSDWLSVHKTGLKPRTGERYEQISRDYIYPYIGKIKFHDLRLDKVEKLYQNLLQEGVTIRNVRYAHSILHRSLQDAVRRGLVGFNAAHGARQPKMPYKEMQILDENQVMQFFLCVKNDCNEALYHLAIKTGMRKGELLGLKWSDLDWNRGTLRIQRQAQRIPGKGRTFVSLKTRAGKRTISPGSETLQLLREHKSRQQLQKALEGVRWQDLDLIFPSKVGTIQSGSNVLKRFKALLESASLPPIRFHDLRHTTASMMLIHGVTILVVSKILGHSQPSTTLNIYGHLIPAANENVGDQMDELLTAIPIDMGEKSVVAEPNQGAQI